MKFVIIDLEDNILYSDWEQKTVEKTKLNDEDNIKIMKCLKKIFDAKKSLSKTKSSVEDSFNSHKTKDKKSMTKS